jgi:hypothetical protein
MVANVRLGSQAAKYGLLPGDTVLGVATPAKRMSALWFTLPALLILGLIALAQRTRSRRLKAAARPDGRHATAGSSLQ